ncbi:MAG: hypothetical protein LBD29_04965 [Treponema sp.]|jgi:AraC family transcriptional regulator|nr:hypothetical protein [Treponema sp.]
MVGIKHDGENSQGFDVYEYPEKAWLIFEANGKISENILGETWKKYMINTCLKATISRLNCQQ